jgi:hypothetical protein
VSGSAGVMALVLAETVAGAAALLWFVPLWREVKRGFFKLTCAIVLTLAFAAWWSARAGMIPGDRSGRLSVQLALTTLAVMAVTTALLFTRFERTSRRAGFLSVALSMAVLAAMASTGRQAYGVSLFQLLAGAAFLGSVTDGLLLGHWYLTDRRLPRAPIDRYTTIMLVAVGVEAVAVISGGFQGTGASQAINPLLTAGALAPWIALGMVAATGLIAALTRAALKGERASAVQSATGFYYLAVVTAFTAELAVKTRFLAT